MPTKLVLGLQHGDEGKGRVVDDIAGPKVAIIFAFLSIIFKRCVILP